MYEEKEMMTKGKDCIWDGRPNCIASFCNPVLGSSRLNAKFIKFNLSLPSIRPGAVRGGAGLCYSILCAPCSDTADDEQPLLLVNNVQLASQHIMLPLSSHQRRACVVR